MAKKNTKNLYWAGGIALIAAAAFTIISGLGNGEKKEHTEFVDSNLQSKIAFGKLDSKIDVYLFTSWGCPACKKLEPMLPTILPEIEKKARIIFVDHISDTKTLNFAPYDLAFMVYNKPKYLEIREMLRKVGMETETPNDQQIEKAAAKINVQLKQLHYADVERGIDFFKQLSTTYDISKLPTAIIVNTVTKKQEKLSGTADVTAANILKAIDEVQGE